MKGSIMIVDDDANIRDLLALIVEDDGYATQVARDGSEAMDRLKTGSPPALILLDLMMPRLDGAGFLKALKSDPRLAAIPVVVLSGDDVNRDRLRQLGANGLLVKPLEID